MTMNNDWITVQEAAELSGYHAEYIRTLIRGGKIQAQKFGPVWAVSKEILLQYVERGQKTGDGRHGPKKESPN